MHGIPKINAFGVFSTSVYYSCNTESGIELHKGHLNMKDLFMVVENMLSIEQIW